MKRGTYTYWHKHYGHISLHKYTMPVEVVDERAKQYQVKYLGIHANGAAVGSLHWVRKTKVKIQGETPAERPANIRLPYKD